jgi:hypothetical protein
MSIAQQPAMLPRPATMQPVAGGRRPVDMRRPVRRRPALVRLGVLVVTTASAIALGLTLTMCVVVVLAGGLVG